MDKLELFEWELAGVIDLQAWYAADRNEKKAILEDVFFFAKARWDLKGEVIFVMPKGYESACGMSDPATGNLYSNEAKWDECDEIEPLYNFLHEIRHCMQFALPELFSEGHRLNGKYVLQIDGSCYRVEDDRVALVRLKGEDAYFTELYLASPCERDANIFAYRCLVAAGADEGADALFHMWSPRYSYFREEDGVMEFAQMTAEVDRMIEMGLCKEITAEECEPL